MCARRDLQPMDVPEGESKLPEDVLAVPPSSRTSVRNVSMGGTSTTLEGPGCRINQESEHQVHRILSGECPSVWIGGSGIKHSIDDGIRDSAHAGRERTTSTSMSSHRDEMPIGHQRNVGKGQVQRLRQGAGESSEDRGGAAEAQAGGEVEGREGECHLFGGPGADAARGDGGVRGLQGVSSSPSLPRAGSQGQVDPAGDLMSNPMLSKSAKRACVQARAALGRAELMWKELMNLLSTEPSQVQTAGMNKLRSEVLGHGDKPVPNKKALSMYATLLDRDEKSTKVVAELFNPEVFQSEATKQGLMSGQAFDLSLGHDLLEHGTRQEVRSYIRTMKPGLVVISPPCTWHSIMQNLRPFASRTAEQQKEFLKNLTNAKILLRFAVEIAEEVASYGGRFVIEHPLTSKAWSERVLQRLMVRDDVYLAKGDQCMFGLQSREGIPRRKSTGWCTNSPEIATALEVKCDGQHSHDMIIGKDGNENKSKQAQCYPAGVVQAIIRGYKRDIKEELLHIDFVKVGHLRRDCLHLQRIKNELVTTNEFVSEYDMMAAEEDTTEEQEDIVEPDAVEELPEETVEGRAEKPRYLPRERPFSLRQLIKRAHDGLGHPANDRLVRILRHAGASSEAIEQARRHQCAVCARHEKVKPPRPAAPPRQWQVNQVVGVDTVWLPTLGKKTRMALNIVCWASRFQMVIPLESHTPGAARRAYLQWLRFFGPPERVYVDLGKEFQGAFVFGAEVDSTYYEPSSLEMPTQRSITERAGKTFKEVFSKALEHHTCVDEEEWRHLVDITMMTCNRLMNKSGYSPIQRVLGYSPRVPGGLVTGGADDLATLGQASGGDLAIQTAQAMRLAAARAFHEADCSQALRNALHAGPRPQRDFEVGQLVYFWRKGMDRALKDKPFFLAGPCSSGTYSTAYHGLAILQGTHRQGGLGAFETCQRGGASVALEMD